MCLFSSIKKKKLTYESNNMNLHKIPIFKWRAILSSLSATRVYTLCHFSFYGCVDMYFTNSSCSLQFSDRLIYFLNFKYIYRVSPKSRILTVLHGKSMAHTMGPIGIH